MMAFPRSVMLLSIGACRCLNIMDPPMVCVPVAYNACDSLVLYGAALGRNDAGTEAAATQGVWSVICPGENGHTQECF